MYFPDLRIAWIVLAAAMINHAASGQSLQFIDTGGPLGGQVYSIALDSSGALYAATDQDGVIKSVDEGLTWSYAGMKGEILYSIVAAPNGDLYTAGYADGIMRSTNQGLSWDSCATPLRSITRRISVNTLGHLFVRTDDGVFRSTDNGAVWKLLDVPPSTFWSFDIAFAPSGKIFAFAGTAANLAIVESNDDGDHWTVTFEFDSVLTASLHDWYNNGSFLNNFAFATGGSIVIATSGGILRSTNSGRSWQHITKDFDSLWISCVFPGSGGKIYAVADAPYVTTDAGAHWQKCSKQFFGRWGSCGVVTANNKVIVGTNGFGVYTSDDNEKTWKQSMAAAPGVFSLVVNSSGHVFAGTYGGGVYRYNSGTAQWVNLGLSGGIVRSMIADGRGVIYAALSSGSFDTISNAGIYRSTNDGANWERISGGLAKTSATVIAQDSSGWMYAGTDSGIYRSSNRGAQWVLCTSKYLHALTISAWDTNNVICSAYGAATAMYSTDHGATWSAFKGLPSHASTGSVTGIASDRGANLYLSFWGTNMVGGGLFRSRDRGASWEAFNPSTASDPGGYEQNISAMAIDAFGNIIVGNNEYDVEYLRSGTTNWDEAVIDFSLTFRNLAQTRIESIATDSGGHVWIGTSMGAFRSSRPLAVDVQAGESQPAGFHLHQNFPNPFSSTTSIEYTVRQHGNVSIAVFNCLGEKVVTLLNSEEQDPGLHSVGFRADDFADGVYMFRIVTSAGTQSGTMTVAH